MSRRVRLPLAVRVFTPAYLYVLFGTVVTLPAWHAASSTTGELYLFPVVPSLTLSACGRRQLVGALSTLYQIVRFFSTEQQ